MKQIDYLKLVATGRKSTHFARPSDADAALNGLVGFGAIVSLGLTFGAAVLYSYAGVTLEMNDVGLSLLATLLAAIALGVLGLFIGGAPVLVRLLMVLICLSVVLSLLLLALTGRLEFVYLYAPAFIYAVAVGFSATRQLG